MEITSIRNPLLQKIRKAVNTGRPTEDGFLIAEGPHLLEEALRSAWRVHQVVTTPDARSRYADLLAQLDAEIVEVPVRTFEAAAETQHSQHVLALLQPKTWRWEELARGPALILALDAIQDPGNAGTIIRSAEAFGATGVILLKGSAHISNGKLLRASAGSAFRIPYIENLAAADFLAATRGRQWRLYALDGTADQRITSADLKAPCVLIAGNEGGGVSRELLNAATRVAIPTVGVESLNAAVACSIALFNAFQQRQLS